MIGKNAVRDCIEGIDEWIVRINHEWKNIDDRGKLLHRYCKDIEGAEEIDVEGVAAGQISKWDLFFINYCMLNVS